jgi:hypothetical protein
MAAAIAVAAHIVYIFWIQQPLQSAGAAEPRRPRVTVLPDTGRPGGALLREQIDLFDQQPLSMPTRWNAGAQGLPADVRRQPGEVFGMYDPRMVFAADRLEPAIGPRGDAPADGRAGLRIIGPMAGGWEGVGRVDRAVAAFPARDAAVEVRRFGPDGDQVVLRDTLQDLPRELDGRDWPPVEFSVAVATTGLVGLPTVEEGSGVEVVDTKFGSLLASQLNLGERLPPGLYRVQVSP